LWLLAPFVHTPPHPVEGRWQIELVRIEQATASGRPCVWEAEQLTYEGRAVWVATPPGDESFCRAPGEAARMVDVLGEDGPFLSVRLEERRCCPERVEVTPCVTYDLRSGTPVSLEAYDPDRFDWRSKKLTRVLERRHGGGWTAEPWAFVVDRGHVRVCATRGDERLEVPIR
jgi:hypothetical protein